MPTSNTRDCFRELIGHGIVGCLFDALPPSDRSLSSGSKALVLDDGRALVIHANGSFYIESAEDVRRAVALKKSELENVQADLRGVLELAGERSNGRP